MRQWFESDDKLFSSQLLATKLLGLAKNRGCSVDKLLRGTGMFLEDLTSGGSYISYRQMQALVQNTTKYTNSPDLSFLIGRRLLSGNTEPAAEVLANGRNLNDILRNVQIYQRQLFPLLYCQRFESEQSVFLIINPAVQEDEEFKFFLELLCSAINAMCKWHFGHQAPLHFHFSFQRPRNIYQYEENLGHRLYFDAPLNMVEVDKEWAGKTLMDSDPLTRQVQRKLATNIRKKHKQHQGLLQHVMIAIQNEPKVTLRDVAAKMAMSPATLKRKLKLHNTSFQRLQDRLGKQRAVFDLSFMQLTNEQAANRLNIDSLANFRRAVKRWTGMTPSEVKSRINGRLAP